jgi:hypothetical protein
MRTFTKDPQAKLDYGWDWTEWLGTDSIQSATVTVSPNDGSLHVVNTTTSGTKVVAVVSGGNPGQRYALTCHITTTGGLEDERTIYLDIHDQ